MYANTVRLRVTKFPLLLWKFSDNKDLKGTYKVDKMDCVK